MSNQLLTFAEKEAEKAENLSAFSGIKLLHIRNQIQSMLELFGRGNVFDQYTKHDISHIDGMLKLTEWLIPKPTLDKMTNADWLMLVLSIYFHDLGLLVTKQEFENRENRQGYVQYKNDVEAGVHGIEFKEKVDQLKQESEYFLYQEYVRANHAHRIKEWIEGSVSSNEDREYCNIINEINNLLTHLSPSFRRDLALICESHHLDDLDNFEKYNPRSNYGNDSNESVNLHYIAIILRTADLLHITSERTPSVQYRLIAATDPKSVVEWNKQKAVSAVTSKPNCDSEGHIKDDLPRDTIEITAYFDQSEQADAYFGLMSYIRYAENQLILSSKYIQESIKTQGTGNYQFPWKSIDDKNIRTSGFEQKQFSFTLDQSSILQLLIGHTLYNDASVVVRELIQNAIDAIQLRQIELSGYHQEEGKIIVEWNSSERILSFCDNGTGMTVKDIEDYLLKVGASKYRSDEFVKKYPAFSSISRFGIGILTCFMVADQIEIHTKSVSDENVANYIAIRNANGKYLLKKLDINTVDERIKKYGTLIELRVRSDIDMSILTKAAQKWIVLPTCNIELRIDDESPKQIGYKSLKAVLEDYLENTNYPADGKTIRVVEDSKDGINIAYVQEYQRYLDEWRFLSLDSYRYREMDRNQILPTGTCVEGIRVEFVTPGFKESNILSIVNVVGKSNVQTNVARSAIENNAEQDKLLASIYGLYADAIQKEIERCIAEGKSKIRAASMATFLISPLISYLHHRQNDPKKTPLNNEILCQELGNLKCIISESDGQQEVISPNDLIAIDEVHLVISRMTDEAEYLMREIPTNKSFSGLMKYLGADLVVPNGKTFFGNFDKANRIHRYALSGKEAVAIQVDRKQRSIAIDFKKCESNWRCVNIQHNFNTNHSSLIYIPNNHFIINGLEGNEIGVETNLGLYLGSDSKLVNYVKTALLLIDAAKLSNKGLLVELFMAMVFDKSVLEIVLDEDDRKKVAFQYEPTIFRNHWYQTFHSELAEKLWKIISKEDFASQVFEQEYSIYNPYDWSRNPQLKEN